jgi:hypothetical protein
MQSARLQKPCGGQAKPIAFLEISEKFQKSLSREREVVF